MGVCSATTRVCLLIICLVFWSAAASLCYVSSWVLRTYHDFHHVTEATLTLIPVFILLGVAVLMFLIGLLGCIAVCKDSKVLLSVFFSLILVVLLGEVAAGVLGYIYRYKVEDAVSKGLNEAIDSYYNNTIMKNQLDFVQQQLHCCGVHNASDWMFRPGLKKFSVPTSCCNDRFNISCCNATIGSKDVYSEGCLPALEHKFTENLVVIACITFALAGLQILGLVSNCILICRTREPKYKRLDHERGSGVRV